MVKKAGAQSLFCKHSVSTYSLTDPVDNHGRVHTSGTGLSAAEQSSFPEGARAPKSGRHAKGKRWCIMVKKLLSCFSRDAFTVQGS